MANGAIHPSKVLLVIINNAWNFKYVYQTYATGGAESEMKSFISDELMFFIIVEIHSVGNLHNGV